MLNPNEQPWAEFADRVAQELLEHGVSEAAAAYTLKNWRKKRW